MLQKIREQQLYIEFEFCMRKQLGLEEIFFNWSGEAFEWVSQSPFLTYKYR